MFFLRKIFTIVQILFLKYFFTQSLVFKPFYIDSTNQPSKLIIQTISPNTISNTRSNLIFDTNQGIIGNYHGYIEPTEKSKFPVLIFDKVGNLMFIIIKIINILFIYQINKSSSSSFSLDNESTLIAVSQYDTQHYIIEDYNSSGSILRNRIINLDDQSITYLSTTQVENVNSMTMFIFHDKTIISIVLTSNEMIGYEWGITDSLFTQKKEITISTIIYSTFGNSFHFVEVSNNFGFFCFLKDTGKIYCFGIDSDLNLASPTNINLTCNLPQQDSIALTKLADNYGVIGCNSNSFFIQIIYQELQGLPISEIQVHLSVPLEINDNKFSYYQFSVLSNYKIFLVCIEDLSEQTTYYYLLFDVKKNSS